MISILYFILRKQHKNSDNLYYIKNQKSIVNSINTLIMKDGMLLVCDAADKIKETAGTDNFEQAFIRIVKGVAK